MASLFSSIMAGKIHLLFKPWVSNHKNAQFKCHPTDRCMPPIPAPCTFKEEKGSVAALPAEEAGYSRI